MLEASILCALFVLLPPGLEMLLDIGPLPSVWSSLLIEDRKLASSARPARPVESRLFSKALSL